MKNSTVTDSNISSLPARIIHVLFLIFYSLLVTGQCISINNTNAPADASAILDISSSQKGVLFPRMNTGQRTAIVNPAQSLMVYDTDTRSYWFFENTWKEVAAGGPLTLPYSASISTNVNLFDITNPNGVAGTAVIKGKQTNAGSGINIPLSIGVWGDNSNGGGVAGTSNTGIGTYGVSNANHGVWGSSNSANHAGVYGTSITNFGTAVLGEINQSGTAILGRSQGADGKAAYFVNTLETNNSPTVDVANFGTGNIMQLTNTNAATAIGLKVINNGSNAGIYVANNHPTSTAASLWVNNYSHGHGIVSVTGEPSNPFPAIGCNHVGSAPGIIASSNLGIGGKFEIENLDNLNPAIYASTITRGIAATFEKTNGSGTINETHDPCVLIDNNSKGAGLKIDNIHYNSANPAIDVHQVGQAAGIYSNHTTGGIAIKGFTTAALKGAIVGENMSESGYGVYGIGHGILGIGVIGINEQGNEATGAVTGITNGVGGNGVFGQSYGTYSCGVRGSSGGTDGAGVYGENSNGGYGVRGQSNGIYPVGVLAIANPNPGASGTGLLAYSTGTGYGIKATSGNNGSAIWAHTSNATNAKAGLFETNNTTTSSETVQILNGGLGKSLNITCSNSNNSTATVVVTKSGTGDFIIFEAGNGDNKIRFDNTGKGFFNGGTQNSGADIAESFEVENEINTYEPGDVLVISLDSDRTVTKSAAPYSTLVAGVYATKPGVLLTENDIDADLSDEVPMGVVGVIPTKVCLEGGSIQRGDFIVTSSLPGVAMKGDPDKVKVGQVIGKALENYDADEIGKIKVLVSVK